jgi:eukaryotic translation initiation factor 2-alpha kinase 4
MPAKQRKKPSREQKQSSDFSLTSPAKATTNYHEIHELEVEALRSIYGDDYEDVETRRSAWQVGVESEPLLHLRLTVVR